MSRPITVPVTNLGGSINDLLEPHEIGPSETPNDARNIRIHGEGKSSRPGYVTVLDTLTGGTKIQGLTFYDRDLAADDRLAGVYNKKIIIADPDTDASWTQTATTITVDTTTSFSKYKDWLFCFNGVDEPGRFNGAVYDEPFTKPDSITLATDFTPSFGVVAFNSLIVSGVPIAPNVAYISKPASSATPTDILDFSGAIGSGAADEVLSQSRFTSIRAMSDYVAFFDIDGAAVMKGFKELGATIIPDISPVPGADGANSHDCTVVVENDIYYITTKREIKSLKRGFAESITTIVDPASKKLKKFMRNKLDPDQSGAKGYYDRNRKLLKFHVKSLGSSFNDLVIIGDINHIDPVTGFPLWFIDNGKAFSSGVFYKNNKSYVVSDIIGQCYEEEIGFADDDDAPINTFWNTKDFNANNPTTQKRYQDVSVFGSISFTTVLTIRVFVDDILAEEVVVDSSKLPPGSLSEGGIAIEAIAEEAIADDSDDSEITELFEFVERIPFRSTGKKLRIQFETNDINQNYDISHLQYTFLPLGRMNVPAKEML